MSDLEQARSYVEQNAAKGLICPCCDTFVKIYTRKLNSGMVSILYWIYRYSKEKSPENGWFHVNNGLIGYNQNAMAKEYSKLKYWGLIEQAPKESQNYSGFWRITALGKAFLEGHTTVMSHIRLTKKKFLGFSGKPVSFVDCTKEHFDLIELMNS